jgi:hypothetical protein
MEEDIPLKPNGPTEATSLVPHSNTNDVVAFVPGYTRTELGESIFLVLKRQNGWRLLPSLWWAPSANSYGPRRLPPQSHVRGGVCAWRVREDVCVQQHFACGVGDVHGYPAVKYWYEYNCVSSSGQVVEFNC